MSEVNEIILCGASGCRQPQHARGVCLDHWKEITSQVEAGQVTWKQYEEAGVCKPIRDQSKPPSRRCLSNGCPRLSRARGLCDDCYAAAVRIMKSDNLRWEDLERMGLSRKARVRSTAKQSIFIKNARKAIEDAKDKLQKSYAPMIVGPTSEPVQPTIPVTQSEPLPMAAKGHEIHENQKIEFPQPTLAPSPLPLSVPPATEPTQLQPSPTNSLPIFHEVSLTGQADAAEPIPLAVPPIPLRYGPELEIREGRHCPVPSTGQPETIEVPPAASLPTPEELAVMNAPAPEPTPEAPAEDTQAIQSAKVSPESPSLDFGYDFGSGAGSCLSTPREPEEEVQSDPVQFPGPEGGVQ